MNKLGFYLHLSIDQNGLWEAINRVRPPVILIHADTANTMLLEETRRLLANYDRFQVAFRQRLQAEGVEAVAFNFGAGNFSTPEHYLEFFPGTLAAYRYLGFHEYGWPTLLPSEGAATSAGLYRRCL